MSSRQQQQTSQQSRSSTQPYQKNFAQGGAEGGGGGGTGTPQRPPPPYPSPKRFKSEPAEQKPAVPAQTPAFYLTQQQLQMLHCLQQNANNLQPAQQVIIIYKLLN